MKRLILFALLFSAFAVPALGELTDADLDKIRLIVNKVVKAEIATVKQDLKAEIATVKQDLKAEIATVKQDLREQIADSEKNVRTDIDIQSEGIHKQIALLTNFVYALIALIVAAIAIPQVILTWRSSRDNQQQRINQELRAEIETLKRQQSVHP